MLVFILAPALMVEIKSFSGPPGAIDAGLYFGSGFDSGNKKLFGAPGRD